MPHHDFELMLRDYRLTTAEIFYHFPDHPKLLQTYIWQNLDLAPKFPNLKQFLGFWEEELEGKLHSVMVTNAMLLTPADVRFTNGEIIIH